MPRAPRGWTEDVVFHVVNRGNDRRALFDGPDDYDAFVGLMFRARVRVDMRVLAYCLMPNHWHLVLWPREQLDLGRFVGWISQVHAQRRRVRAGTIGHGHMYQDRYRSFRVDGDDHFLTVCRYVERNALAAKRVARAEDWRWSSLRLRLDGDADGLLSPWRTEMPADWTSLVNSERDAPRLEDVHPSPRRRRAGTVPVSGAGAQTA
jgi:putative transposase